MDSIRSVLTAIQHGLAWLPDVVVAVLILALAVGVALSLHRSVRRLVRHSLADRDPYLFSVLVLMRAADVLVVVVTLGAALMTFEPVRQYGVSLFASAGVAGIVAGLAARPVLSNLFAGVQLAMTQPIRIDDAVIVEGEWGTIEEITSTYVVVRIWDLRRMIVPLTYFIEKPFQNWTREGSELIGSDLIYVDYAAPVGAIREKLGEIVKNSKNWDGNVINLQVTDAKEQVMELRCLMSARSAGQAFNLRCEVREKLIDFLKDHHPEALPRQRSEAAVSALPKPRLQRPRRQYATRRVAPPKAKPPLCCSACCVSSKPLVILPRNSSGAGSSRFASVTENRNDSAGKRRAPWESAFFVADKITIVSRRARALTPEN